MGIKQRVKWSCVNGLNFFSINFFEDTPLNSALFIVVLFHKLFLGQKLFVKKAYHDGTTEAHNI